MAALTRKQLRHVKRSFRSFAGSDLLIDPGEWKDALAIKNDFFLERIFELVDTDQSGFIDLDEFVAFSASLFADDKKQRLEFIFRVYDIDGDGKIDAAEIKQVLEASLAEQRVKLDAPIVSRLVTDFMRKTDTDKNKEVSLDEFVKTMSDFPGIDEQFSVYAASWLSYGRKLRLPRIAAAAASLRLRRWWQGYRKPLVWSAMYVAGNVAMFASAAQHYADTGASTAIQIARGAGACLDLNVALVLIPVCKSFWTWVRQTPLGSWFPLEDPIRIHRTIAYALAVFTVAHVGAHSYNYLSLGKSPWREFASTAVGVTGAVATIALIFMFWSGRSIGKRRYEWFVISHLGYAAFIGVLLYHSPLLLPWLAPPLLFFLGESLVRLWVKTKGVAALELTPLTNGVTKVAFEKPKKFRFFPGDYVRLQVPAISKTQWHPFTISAAPEAGSMELYVRNNGDWSGALHNLSRKNSSRGVTFPARIDGPYGTPSSGVHRAEVAILIAAGIGVTPFASLLHSIVVRGSKEKESGKKAQSVHFHWLNRSQHSYEWFMELLAEAERVLGSEHFKLNIHLTSLTYDLTNIAMQVAMDAYRNRRERDPITGLYVQTSAGRPNWDAVFNETSAAHPNEKIEVFFCGPPALGASVRLNCRKHGFLFHDEKF